MGFKVPPRGITREGAGQQLLDLMQDPDFSVGKAISLVKAGADVNMRDERGNTPLILTALHEKFVYIHSHKKLAEKLLQHGARLEDKNNDGMTALHLAASFGLEIDDNLGVLQALIKNGADVNARTKYGITPLMYATQSGHHHMVKLLLEKGAKPDAVTDNGGTALNIARDNWHKGTFELLQDALAKLPPPAPAPEKPASARPKHRTFKM